MNHKLLLGSTALVSAGLLMGSVASAQERRGGGMEVRLSGYTEWGVKAANEDTLKNSNNTKNYLFFMDNEVHVRANGSTDGGLLYGSKIEIEAGSGDGNQGNVTIDEAGLFFSGGFGRIELGKDDGANNVMGIGAADAQAGTGGIDGDSPNLIQFESLTDGDSNKVTYFTPRIAGIQLGASFTPASGDGFSDDQAGEFEDMAAGGINWVGVLGPVDLTIAADGIIGNGQQNTDDLRSWDAGFLAGFGGFTFGVQGGQNTDVLENDFISVGLKYGFGAANVSVGWVYNNPSTNNFDDSQVIAVSGDVGLMSGVTLKGDVTYNTDDPGSNCPNGTCNLNNVDSTVAGVVSIQLDY